MGKKLRGFASMDPEKQRRIASMGGKAGHQQAATLARVQQEQRILEDTSRHPDGCGVQK